MSFYSIYQPAYVANEYGWNNLKRRFWYTVGVVLLLHAMLFLVLTIQPILQKKDQLDEIVIEVTTVSEAPDGVLDGVKTEEPKKISPPIKTAAQSKTSNFETKPDDFVIQEPKKEIKPEPKLEPKPEPKPENKVTENKKNEAPVQSTVDVPTLPTVVDKKDKDKDAPTVAAPSEAPSRAADSATSQSSEFQAQVSAAPPMGIPGGSAPTVDADYKSSTLHNQKPPYPMMAYKMKQQGTVVLLTEVLTTGKVGEIKISRSSGFELLDKSAVETVRRWTFSPARRDGVVYVQTPRIPITFNLKDK